MISFMILNGKLSLMAIFHGHFMGNQHEFRENTWTTRATWTLWLFDGDFGINNGICTARNDGDSTRNSGKKPGKTRDLVVIGVLVT